MKTLYFIALFVCSGAGVIIFASMGCGFMFILCAFLMVVSMGCALVSAEVIE